MTIQKNLVPASKYPLKCPYTMTPIGLCVHNTANDAPSKGEISYMVSNTKQTSFHLAVDDIEIWQGLPLDRNGWHAGDGANGEGNRKYIAIEICYSKSGGDRFTKAEDNASQLIADLLKERNWGIEKVKKHQDFSGKYCPHRTLDLGWSRFISIIKSKMGVSMPETVAVEKAKFEELVTKSTKLDEISATGYVLLPAHNAEVSNLQNEKKAEYQRGYKDGVASVPSNPIVPVDWEENGMSVEVTEGNKKTITNYRRKL